MLEHQGALYGYSSPELETEIRARYLAKFYPLEETWKTQVLLAARSLFLNLFRRAALTP